VSAKCGAPSFKINEYASKNKEEYDIYFAEWDGLIIPKPTKSISSKDLNIFTDMSMYDRFPMFDQEFTYTGIASAYYPPGFPGQDEDDSCGMDWLCMLGFAPVRPDTDSGIYNMRQKKWGLGRATTG